MSFSSSKTAIPISRIPGSIARMRNGMRLDLFMGSVGGLRLFGLGLGPEVRERKRDGVEDVHPLVFAHVDLSHAGEPRAKLGESLGDGLCDRLLVRLSDELEDGPDAASRESSSGDAPLCREKVELFDELTDSRRAPRAGSGTVLKDHDLRLVADNFFFY